jgi:hypothetical protein
MTKCPDTPAWDVRLASPIDGGNATLLYRGFAIGPRCERYYFDVDGRGKVSSVWRKAASGPKRRLKTPPSALAKAVQKAMADLNRVED